MKSEKFSQQKSNQLNNFNLHRMFTGKELPIHKTWSPISEMVEVVAMVTWHPRPWWGFPSSCSQQSWSPAGAAWGQSAGLAPLPAASMYTHMHPATHFCIYLQFITLTVPPVHLFQAPYEPHVERNVAVLLKALKYGYERMRNETVAVAKHIITPLNCSLKQTVEWMYMIQHNPT